MRSVMKGLLGGVAFGLLVTLFFTMPPRASNAALTGNNYVVPQTPNIGAAQFVQGTDAAGTYKTIYTGATNGSKCFALMLNHDDQAVTHQVTIRIVHSATSYDIATYTTVLSAGASNTFGITANLMSLANWPGLATDVGGNSYIYLTNGDTLRATFATNLSSTDQINIIATCSDF
jgi:hypothetical protein